MIWSTNWRKAAANKMVMRECCMHSLPTTSQGRLDAQTLVCWHCTWHGTLLCELNISCYAPQVTKPDHCAACCSVSGVVL